ncbi:MAG: hypothetical protein ACI9HK_000419 [Pirellulaceae bacterium]|jgi:hypothetical protein
MKPYRFQSSIVCFVAIGFASLLAGCSPTATGHATPESVYAASQEAIKAQDYGKLADCFTAEAQHQTAGGFVMNVAMLKKFAKLAAMQGPAAVKKAEEKLGPMLEVLTKHGVGDEKLTELVKGVGIAGIGNSREANERAGALIDDKRGFISDVSAAYAKITAAEGQPPAASFTGELKDLQVDGDTATGAMFNGNARQKNEPITFKKVEGKGWLIDVN